MGNLPKPKFNKLFLWFNICVMTFSICTLIQIWTLKESINLKLKQKCLSYKPHYQNKRIKMIVKDTATSYKIFESSPVHGSFCFNTQLLSSIRSCMKTGIAYLPLHTPFPKECLAMLRHRYPSWIRFSSILKTKILDMR